MHVSGHLGQFTGREQEGHQDHDEDVRVGPLSSPWARRCGPKDAAIAGDLAVVAKLPAAQTSDTLSDKDNPAGRRAVGHAGGAAADRHSRGDARR